MNIGFLRPGGATLVVCLGLVVEPAMAQQQYEPLRQKLVQGWEKARPETGQVVQISFSAANSLPAAMGRAIEGGGRLYARDRAQCQFKEGTRKYELWENANQQAFSCDSASWKLSDSQVRKDHPGLVAFLSPREALDLLLGGGFEKILKGDSALLGPVLCDTYVMELGEGHARPLAMRLGLVQELVSGKLKKRTVYRAVFWVESRAGRLRQVNLTLRVEVDRDVKPAKDGKDWAWESHDDSDAISRIAKLNEKGEPMGGGGSQVRTLMREYSSTLSIEPVKPLDKEPEVPQEAKGLIHW